LMTKVSVGQKHTKMGIWSQARWGEGGVKKQGEGKARERKMQGERTTKTGEPASTNQPSNHHLEREDANLTQKGGGGQGKN